MYVKPIQLARVLALLLLWAIPLSAAPRSDQQIEEAVQNTIDQRHPKDTPEWWRGLGPDAPRVIIGMYAKTTDTYEKSRLAGALSWFPDSPQAVAFLKNEASTTDERIVRVNAIRSLGISQGDRAVPELRAFLDHKDPQTRLAAAQALKQVGTPRAKSELDAYRKREKASWILGKLEGNLPSAPRGLAPVATSEDKPADLLEGRWKGFWIHSRQGSTELVSVPAELLLEDLLDAKPLAKLELEREKGKRQAFALQNVKSSKGKLTAGVALATKPLALQGERVEEAGAVILNVRVPEAGVFGVFRKQ